MRSAKFGLVAIGITLLMSGRSGEPLRAQARPTTVSATEPSDLRAWDQRVDRMMREDELRVRRTIDDPLLPGRSYLMN
jgi:hypothetical protein